MLELSCMLFVRSETFTAMFIVQDHSYAADLPSAQPVSPLLVEQIGGYIDIEDVSCNTTVVTVPLAKSSDSSGGDDQYEGSVTRCICDFQHDDGYMICCDRCGRVAA